MMNPWYLIGFFIALGPVYWFGPLGYNEMTVIKALFLSAFLLTAFVLFFTKRRPFVFPSIFGFHSLIIILSLLILSGLKSASFSVIFLELFKYVLPFLMIWLVYNISFYFDEFETIVSKISLLIPLVSILIVVSFFFSVPNWRSPFYDSALGYVTLDFTGFGSTRTAWSNGIALLYPLLIIGGYKYFVKNRMLLIIVILLMILTVFFPGGRGGLISVLITTFFALKLYIPNRSLSTIISILAIILLISVIIITGSDTRALRKLPSDNDLNSLSSGRIDGFAIGLDIIENNPINGLGINNVNLRNYGQDVESIHNFWISSGAEYGVLFPMLFIYLFFRLGIAYFNKRKFLRVNHKASFYVIIAGLFMSNLEPGGIIGAFQQQAIFWICVGRLLYLLKYKSEQRFHY